MPFQSIDLSRDSLGPEVVSSRRLAMEDQTFEHLPLSEGIIYPALSIQSPVFHLSLRIDMPRRARTPAVEVLSQRALTQIALECFILRKMPGANNSALGLASTLKVESEGPASRISSEKTSVCDPFVTNSVKPVASKPQVVVHSFKSGQRGHSID